MMKRAKKLGLALSCLSLALCAGVGFGTMTKTQAAAENDDLTINAGASIRMNTNKDETTGEVVGYDTGIRFGATASEELVSKLVDTTGETVSYKAGAELGMFIVPQSYIAAYNAQAEKGTKDYFDYFYETKGLEKSKFTYVCNADELNVTGETQYNVSIVELLEENYNRSYQAVAYYAMNDENGEQVYYYTNTSDARTVSYVANAALLDTETTYNAEQRAALGNIIERAIQLKATENVEGDVTGYTVALHGDNTFDLKSYFASEITDPALLMSVTEGSEAVAIENNVVSATKYGETAKVNVTAYDGEVNFDVTVKTLEKDKTEVVDFVAMSDLYTAKTVSKDSKISYLESFEGATGVAKMTATKNWGHFGFQPVYDMATYADSVYVVMRMYIVKSGSLWFGGGNNCLTDIETGKWVDYYFPAQVFKKNWANCTTNYVVESMALTSGAPCEIYIDEIFVTGVGNEILTFSEKKEQMGYTVAGNGSTITYEESFEGATGVAKVVGGSWGYFGFKPLQDLSAYEGCEFVVMRMYIVEFTSGNNLWFGDGFNCKTTIQKGAWVDYYFPCSSFIKCWANWESKYTINSMSLSANCAYQLYVDEIYAASVTPATGNEVLTFNEKGQLGFTTALDSTITWEESFAGATGVAKMTATGGWGHFGFRPMQDMATYADSEYIVFRMYIANGFTGSLWFGGGNNCQTAIKTGEWKNYYFPAEVFKTNWANATTAYNVYKMALVASSACTMYVDEIYTTKVTPATGNEVLTFDEQAQVDLYAIPCHTMTTIFTYQESFEGATGVVKVSDTDSWGGIGFKPLQDMSVYADSTYIVMRMYIVKSGSLWLGGGKNCLTTIETNKWVDYYFPAEVFKTNWANCATNYNLGSMALTNGAACEFYVDEIFVTNEMPA